MEHLVTDHYGPPKKVDYFFVYIIIFYHVIFFRQKKAYEKLDVQIMSVSVNLTILVYRISS